MTDGDDVQGEPVEGSPLPQRNDEGPARANARPVDGPPMRGAVFAERREEWRIESSPFPSGETVRALERALPGAGDRAFQMAEREQAHRHMLERREQEAFWRGASRSQVFLFVIVVAMLGLGVLLVLKDQGTIGISMIVSDLLFVCWAIGKDIHNVGGLHNAPTEEDNVASRDAPD